MQERVIEFVNALRAAGVRISLAESLDALRAAEQAGVAEREFFRAALQAALVKDHQDQPAFVRLFPLYFGGAGVAMLQPGDDGSLSAVERVLLASALGAVLEAARPPHLADLFQAMIEGRPLSRAQLNALLEHTTPAGMSHTYFQKWMARRALRELQFEQLELMLRSLLERLRAHGMAAPSLREVEESARMNMAALEEQIGSAVGEAMMRRAIAERLPPPPPPEDLIDRPFHLLTYQQTEELRKVVARLAARLRSRVELRQRKARRGVLDAKATIRAGLRFSGVPFDVRRRRKRLKPRLVILCDLSTSMRPVASFMLALVYALQDQVSRARSFAYVDELAEISADFARARPDQAIAAVLARIRADYARTDLGYSLGQFARGYLSAVDHRTTVIVLGDGRNNYSDPGLAHLKAIQARAHRLIWFNPESRRAWVTGDSDMTQYEPLCDAVHVVSNLRELAAAVEEIFIR